MRAKLLTTKEMRARTQTNPNIVQISLIAHKDEWRPLVEALSEIECNSDMEAAILSGFHHVLNQVVFNSQDESSRHPLKRNNTMSNS
jgi:hypothetical protein